MFIQTETTPNPATLKFLPGESVAGRVGLEVSADRASVVSPLAARLFALEGIERVFLGGDFISVSKGSDYDWTDLKPPVLTAIMDHFLSGEPTVLPAAEAPHDPDNPDSLSDAAHPDGHALALADDDPVVQQIKDLLDEYVRPTVAMDGGDITFHGFDDGVVYLTMKGACAGCPSSTATLQMGIERLLRYYVPEVVAVRPAQDAHRDVEP